MNTPGRPQGGSAGARQVEPFRWNSTSISEATAKIPPQVLQEAINAQRRLYEQAAGYPQTTSSTPGKQQSYTSGSAVRSTFPSATSTFTPSSTATGSTSTFSSSYTPSTSFPTATPSYSSSLTTGLTGLSGAAIVPAGAPAPSARAPGIALDEDGDADDELLPAMADDDYSAQLSWQSQSKDNLKVLMDNFTPLQYDRFEAYRRHALPKQAVRKVIQQSVGLQVSPPVAQIVAGVAKVFVGEIVEKARAVQARRGETGPLTPDHLREAYRIYQEETGRIGSARPLRGKKLFVK
ncbi:hTAFII28-like protein conserved region-domain-containing protein [Mycena pura]|uniref:Transcription initiation factor TFIID subunit 11 n=1 Tax=Mycena pura TaxID=153505 RepID=A0AAD6V3K9_9AGAR|nr:hTAFII28-like protein conserved region-domain-containing protein [Mycena pura]